MTLKTKIIISVVALLTAFSFGRYSKNSPPEVKTKETINSETKTDQDKDTHTHTVTTTTKDNTGDTKTITVTDTDTMSKTERDNKTTKDLQQTVTPQKQSKVNISALGAMDFSKSLSTPTYGLGFQKEFIGPITVGAFGLMNGVIGVSIGLDF